MDHKATLNSDLFQRAGSEDITRDRAITNQRADQRSNGRHSAGNEQITPQGKGMSELLVILFVLAFGLSFLAACLLLGWGVYCAVRTLSERKIKP